jgi:hypothetical protein
MSRELGIINHHEHVTLETESGRTIHLWLHECENCVSLDVWTDRGRDDEPISANTGDLTRAPIGVFTIVQGARHNLQTGKPPIDGSCGRQPLSTAMLVWLDGES